MPIKSKIIKNSIIDIRDNGGGDDGNDMELASYIIGAPFKENKFRRMNSSELSYPESLHPAWKKGMGFSSQKTPEQLKQKN